MRLVAIILSLPFVAPTPVSAQQPDAVPELTKELKASAPSPWEVRVRWRDGQLLASITPWPYDEAFKLWYDQTRLNETLRGLCPKQNAPVWGLINPGRGHPSRTYHRRQKRRRGAGQLPQGFAGALVSG